MAESQLLDASGEHAGELLKFVVEEAVEKALQRELLKK
jgi:hypothetical protein